MGVGGSFSDASEGLTVRVTSAVDGGFRISVTSRATKRCADLLKQIEFLRVAIANEADIHLRKQLISALARAMAEFREPGLRAPTDHRFGRGPRANLPAVRQKRRPTVVARSRRSQKSQRSCRPGRPARGRHAGAIKAQGPGSVSV
jgi:hypothetical protein